MAYIEASTIIEGALEETETFQYADEYQEWLDATIEELADVDAQVYAIHHEHDLDVDDCACVQYLTDHAPVWSNA